MSHSLNYKEDKIWVVFSHHLRVFFSLFFLSPSRSNLRWESNQAVHISPLNQRLRSFISFTQALITGLTVQIKSLSTTLQLGA